MTYTHEEEEDLIVVKQKAHKASVHLPDAQSTNHDERSPLDDDAGVLSSCGTESNASSLTLGRRHHHLQHQSTTLSTLTCASDEPEASPPPKKNVEMISPPVVPSSSSSSSRPMDPFSSFTNGERLVIPEWINHHNNYRSKSGWQGQDLVHSVHSAVRVLDYYCQYGPGSDIHGVVPASTTTSSSCTNDDGDSTAFTVPDMVQEVADESDATLTQSSSSDASPPRGGTGTVLTGYVHFTKQAESHKGYCHGGAACSIMDDVLGWAAFCVTGRVRPWSGYTVQINTQLRRPIPIDSYLYVSATITAVVRRKVYISAEIYEVSSSSSSSMDTSSTEEHRVRYATGEGIVVLNRGILHVPESTTPVIKQ